MRQTKIICTIGPKTASFESILKLARLGMNVARLNMSHGDHLWHKKVIEAIKTINKKGDYSIAILLDTKGPEIRTGDVKSEIKVKSGDQFIFTIKKSVNYKANTVEVNYDDFIKDVAVSDVILIDGGRLSFKVIEKTKDEVITECIDGGIITSRRHINIKGKSSSQPTITEKDWQDIDFGIENNVDFIALSFVKESEAVEKLKEYLKKKGSNALIISKIESAFAISSLEKIIEVSNGVMVARGDLGAELPIEEVPLLQEKIVNLCFQMRKPVIIATHLLESMIENPTPTRAEVTDIFLGLKQKADALMLSGETAVGLYPFKSLEVMSHVVENLEKKIFSKKINFFSFPSSFDAKMEIAKAASFLADNLKVSAIVVFTRRGYMASLVSYFRPFVPIFAFTNMSSVRRKLNLFWGVTAFRIEFSKDPEKTIKKAIEILKEKNYLKKNSQIVVVSDILIEKQYVETIQIRKIS